MSYILEFLLFPYNLHRYQIQSLPQQCPPSTLSLRVLPPLTEDGGALDHKFFKRREVRNLICHDVSKLIFLKKFIELVLRVENVLSFVHEQLIGRCNMCELVSHVGLECVASVVDVKLTVPGRVAGLPDSKLWTLVSLGFEIAKILYG